VSDTDAAARPLWAEVDLDAITHNVDLIRERAGRPVRILAPIKANAYGHGVAQVALHLQSLGVDGLATANLDDAIAARHAGVTVPILLYGSALPAGLGSLLDHDLTPSVWSHDALDALVALAAARGRTIAAHVKVDAGLGRLGVRLDEAAALARAVLAAPGVTLEGIYTHLPFADAAGAAWSARRLAAFAGTVRAIEAEHGIAIEYAQGAASSILTAGLPDGLNTIAPGHLVFGLSPIAVTRAEELGFHKALTAVRARVIHVGRRRRGDDLAGAGPDGLEADATVGVVLFGMDNGYRPAAAPGGAWMLCRGSRCPVVAVSAEYAVIDLSAVPAAVVGDVVTVLGRDGDAVIAVEEVAEQLGAPSAAYWLVALRNVPVRYRGGGS
jgi:alanine racemase